MTSTFYRVRFEKMTADWDRWIPQEKVMKIWKKKQTEKKKFEI